LRIGRWDADESVLVVAEIGNNHEGSLELAQDLIGRAAEAGVGAVKFQTITPESLVAPSQPERLQQLERFALPEGAFEKLSEVAKQQGVLFISTPFDMDAVDQLLPLVPAYKVSSGDLTFIPLLEKIARTGKPVILSTGMATMDEVRQAVRALDGIWGKSEGPTPGLALLHCVSAYPTPSDQANLAMISTLRRLGHVVGYSDHTLGVEAAILAVALGARIIEKHFTVDRARSTFRDHQLSADPSMMKELVTRVRSAVEMLGSVEKRVLPAEVATREASRRSIVAARDLLEGTTIEIEDLTWLRPSGGLSPGQEGLLLGERLGRSIGRGEPIRPEDLR
jgi:N,N'-diacetyllegionaminate synthase